MSHHSAADWTYSEYARLPDDGQKYEVIDGEVCVTQAPGPAHQGIIGRLYRILIEYVERHGLSRVLWDVCSTGISPDQSPGPSKAGFPAFS